MVLRGHAHLGESERVKLPGREASELDAGIHLAKLVQELLDGVCDSLLAIAGIVGCVTWSATRFAAF